MLVVTDPGLRRLGLVDTVLEGAESEGLGVTVYDQVLYCTVLYCTVLNRTVLYCTGAGRGQGRREAGGGARPHQPGDSGRELNQQSVVKYICSRFRCALKKRRSLIHLPHYHL